MASMDGRQLQRLVRLAEAQRAMLEREQARLVQYRATMTALEVEEAHCMTRLGRDGVLGGLVSDLAARRLRSVAEDIAHARSAYEVQRARVMKRNKAVSGTVRLLERARLASAREQEDRALQDLLDAALVSSGAAPRARLP